MEFLKSKEVMIGTWGVLDMLPDLSLTESPILPLWPLQDCFSWAPRTACLEVLYSVIYYLAQP